MPGAEKLKQAEHNPQGSKKPEINQPQTFREETMIQVGHQAPDFSASAYHKGAFIETRLSDHRGKWILLCFYPGDFTFV